MARDFYANTAADAQLSAPVDTVTTTFTVTTTSGWPSTPCWAKVGDGLASMEIVKVTNIAGTTLTVTRGQDGTSASAHSAGDSVSHPAPAKFFNDTEVHRDSASGVHGATGSVVGTTDSQTLTAKRLNLSSARAVFSDATAPSWTAAFEVAGDSAAAKDGFVFTNTAADAARAAFLVTQSGVDRFRVGTAGKVTVSPASGVGIENDGTLQQDGNATFAGTVGVTGALTAGATTLDSATVTNNAVVNGEVQPKRVVWQAAGAATTPRALVKTNSTAEAIRAELDAGTLLFRVTGTGTVEATGDISTLARVFAPTGFFAFGSVLPTVACVTALPTAVGQHQVVVLSTDQTFYRHNGASWQPALAGLTEAAASGDLALGTSIADIPGATVTFTTYRDNVHCLVNGNFDWQATVGGGGFSYGSLAVNGSATGAVAIFGDVVDRKPGHKSWSVTLPTAGSYTLKLQGRKDIAAGNAAFKAGHTTIDVTQLDR